MKYSKQRELVFMTVQESTEHLTADQIYEKLKIDHQNLSLGTVYRNLNQLVEHEMLRRISLTGSPDCFDRRHHEHQHLVCRECGKVIDFHLPYLEEMEKTLRENAGFALLREELLVQGHCKDCQNNIKKEENLL